MIYLKTTKWLVLYGLMLLVLKVESQEVYRWYNHTKINYQLNKTKKLVIVNNSVTKQIFSENISDNWNIISYDKLNKIQSLQLMNNDRNDTSFYSVVIESINRTNAFEIFDGIVYLSDYLISSNNEEIGVSSYFYVKLKQEHDFQILLEQAIKYNVEVIGNDPYMPLWYVLKASINSRGTDALELSCKFYESNIFDKSSPCLILGDMSSSNRNKREKLIKNSSLTIAGCSDEPNFQDQWGLYNTGQYGGTPGVDINYCGAKQITSGDPNIIIAIIDKGTETDHPDLPNVLEGYNCSTNSTPSELVGIHGIPIAGIIGANSNNLLGGTGVAPDCTILPISHNLSIFPGSTLGEQHLALGINWAWENEAAVINCSWGKDSWQNDLIDDALENAITEGRYGLGCVVVFAASNNQSHVNYPANTNDDFLVVGAINQCGERVSTNSCDTENWFSTIGPEVDIMAPGVLISTSDGSHSTNGLYGYNPNHDIHPDSGGTILTDDDDYDDWDYTIWYSGTSAATPFVSGLAGLILSIDECLTNHQVNTFIERSTQKFGSIPYQIEPGRNNGSWNEEMGYGMIDAEAALELVLNRNLLQNFIEKDDILINVIGEIYAGNEVNPNATYGPYIIDNNSTVELKSTISITLEDGFTAKAGSKFLAHIESFNGDCLEWSTKEIKQNPNNEKNNTRRKQSIKTETLLKNNLLIYPNPFDGSILIQLDLREKKSIHVEILDIFGRLLHTNDFDGFQGKNQKEIMLNTTNNLILIKVCIDNNCSITQLINSNGY